MAVKDMEKYQFTSEQSRSEAVKNGQKGGIASGKARQEKATMRKTLEMLLNEKNNKGKTYRELSTLGLIKGAVDGKAENYKIMLQLLGELVETQPNNTPELKIEIVNNEELEKEMYQ